MLACSRSCSIYSGAWVKSASTAALAKQLLHIMEGFPRCVRFQSCQSEKGRGGGGGADGPKRVPIGTSDCLAFIETTLLFVMYILVLRRVAWYQGGPCTCSVVKPQLLGVSVAHFVCLRYAEHVSSSCFVRIYMQGSQRSSWLPSPLCSGTA